MAAGAITTTPETPRHGATSKWLVTGSVMLGTFLSVMDVSVVNVAMPHMMGNFGEDLLTITWVSTSYSIAEIIMITMAPWWTTLLGRKRLFLLSMALFTVASILAGTAQTFHEIIFYRVLQGIGGGSLIPVSQAIARETFPPNEQGMAMAIFAMGVTLAPALGPVVGGWLVDNYGWPWVFYLNVPFAIAGLLMVSAFVHDPAYLKHGIERIDWTGIGLLSIGLTAMQIVLERGEEVDWFASHWIVAGTVLAGRRTDCTGRVGTCIKRAGHQFSLVPQPATQRRVLAGRHDRLRALRLKFCVAAAHAGSARLFRLRGWDGADAASDRNVSGDANRRATI
jgi:MFS family permease